MQSIEPPSLLSTAVKLAPLDPAIAVAISNDYRPMPLNPIIMDCVFKASPAPSVNMPKTMTDAELGASMSSKNQRTKVYSGVKSGALLNVPSLHEMCIRVLQRNIDGEIGGFLFVAFARYMFNTIVCLSSALEATGGVPYDILKPVLDRANPEQLFTLEDYNPYLIEDTGDMWKWHCSRKFRGQVPRELETWRDMFMVSLCQPTTAGCRLPVLTVFVCSCCGVALPRGAGDPPEQCHPDHQAHPDRCGAGQANEDYVRGQCGQAAARRAEEAGPLWNRTGDGLHAGGARCLAEQHYLEHCAARRCPAARVGRNAGPCTR